MLPLSRILPRSGRRGRVPGHPKERLEGIKWVEAAIEAGRELVEVCLEVLGADAVVNAVQPSIEVREHQTDDGQELIRNFWVGALCNRVVIVAVLP